jgi:hypothetical protein
MVVAVLALALLVRSAIPSVPPPSPAPAGVWPLRVLVRVDTRSAEKHVRMADLSRDVRAIWQPYADIVFADTADLAADRYHDELELVISERPGSATSGASALGWITFVAPGRPANVVTVSVATAHKLMAGERWMGRRFEDFPLMLRQQWVTRALGWSAAHEIGHFLLRTTEHSGRGLMRSEVTALDVIGNERRWVQLEPQAIDLLRRRASETGLLTKLRTEPSIDEP